MNHVYDGRDTPTWASPAELRSVAVTLVRAWAGAPWDEEQALVAFQALLRRRRLWYRTSHELAAALRHARRYV